MLLQAAVSHSTIYTEKSGTVAQKKTTHQIYRSSRLGEYRGGRLAGQRTLGLKSYELSNHLGNVLATISDQKLPVDSDTDGIVDYYDPDILSTSDYYPFGLAMEGRSYSGDDYRFGFNGKEDDADFGSGIQDYGMRMYDRKVARFFNVDPLTKKYPELTPYQFASNTPIQAIDLDGLEAFFVHGTSHTPKKAWANRKLVAALTHLTNNKHYSKGFNWAVKSDKVTHNNNLNFTLNRKSDRKQAAELLVKHVLAVRKYYKKKGIEEEVTLIGYSHGGNVAIQAARILYLEHGIKSSIITINTPAFSGPYDPEYRGKSYNGAGIREMINIVSDGDEVPVAIVGQKTHTNIKNIKRQILSLKPLDTVPLKEDPSTYEKLSHTPNHFIENVDPNQIEQAIKTGEVKKLEHEVFIFIFIFNSIFFFSNYRK